MFIPCAMNNWFTYVFTFFALGSNSYCFLTSLHCIMLNKSSKNCCFYCLLEMTENGHWQWWRETWTKLTIYFFKQVLTMMEKNMNNIRLSFLHIYIHLGLHSPALCSWAREKHKRNIKNHYCCRCILLSSFCECQVQAPVSTSHRKCHRHSRHDCHCYCNQLHHHHVHHLHNVINIIATITMMNTTTPITLSSLESFSYSSLTPTS